MSEDFNKAEKVEFKEDIAEDAKKTADEANVEVTEAETVHVSDDEEKKTATQATEPASNKKDKKSGKGKKAALGIVGVLLAIVAIVLVAAIFIFGAATVDTMPKAPSNSDVDMRTFALEATQEVLKENTITVDSADIDVILDEVKKSVNNSTDMIRIDDLFCVLADSEGTLYARIYVGEVNIKGKALNINKTLPVQVDFNVDFDEETKEIIIILDEAKCGKIKIPQTAIDAALNSVELPEEFRTLNGNIYYDTSNLDTMIDDMLKELIAQQINNSSVSGLLSGILGDEVASGLLGSVTDAVSEFATNKTDVQISGARISDNVLIIDGQLM